MKWSTTTTLMLVILTVTCATAGSDRDIHDLDMAATSQQNVHFGAPINQAKADTFYVYGGPGTLDGKFQDASGDPSWTDAHGSWTSVDGTQSTDTKWHISTYNAADIGGGGPGNHAWWCGEVFESCEPGDDPEGYGNNYQERLDWTGQVTENTEDVTVTITFEMEYDSEPGYDGTTLQYRNAAGMVDVMYWDDTDTVGQDPAYSFSFVVTPADYAGDGGDEVLLRFEFYSDGGWSDQDCSWPTGGAVQIDDIAVYFDQGGGNVLMSLEDCEGPPVWRPDLPQGVGDFAKVWPRLDDIDPCNSNFTPVAAFIDDGIVVPGTGGTMCQTWCYGPYGYTTNPIGGLAGPEFHLDNYIVSPAIEWDPYGVYPADCEGISLAFDVYSHSYPTFPGYDGTAYLWAIRSSLDGGLTFGGWQNHAFVDHGTGRWYRRNLNCSSLIESGKTHIQIQLGVLEFGYLWGFVGTDATPSPYFDNVMVKAFTHSGPAISAREINMLQDNFPAIGSIDHVNLGNNSIRIDMASNISLVEHLRNDPGDTMVVDVVPVRDGAEINQKPRMYYLFHTNQIFDSVRDAAFSPSGYVEGDTVHNASGNVVPEKWAFELPDEGWLFPGDSFHWYIEAYDDVGGSIGASIMPADTTGFSDFYNPLAYNSSFTVRGLPTLIDDGGELRTPSYLFWNDFANRGAEEEWYTALRNLGFFSGRDYDIYYTNGPSSGVGNGLGGRATILQIAGYDNILYSCGDLSSLTITNVDYQNDAGDDLGLIDSWLRLGSRNIALFGDNLVHDLEVYPEGLNMISDWLGVSLTGQDVNPLIGNQARPTVVTDQHNSVFSATTEWFLWGGCPQLKTFDAVEPTTGERLAHFLDPAGEDTYDYSAATLNYVAEFDANVISFPYSFMHIWNPTKAPEPSATRTQLLEEILVYFAYLPMTWPADIPSVVTESLSVSPNPFNPQTEIAWRLKRDCNITVEVFNLRGNLVKTLLNDEPRPSMGSVTWNGDNNAGGKVASGVYFARVRAPKFEKAVKIALIK